MSDPVIGSFAVPPAWWSIQAVGGIAVALGFVFLAILTLGYSVFTVAFGCYPTKERRRGPLFEIYLLLIFIKKHAISTAAYFWNGIDDYFSEAERKTYLQYVSVAKSVFLSIVVFIVTLLMFISYLSQESTGMLKVDFYDLIYILAMIGFFLWQITLFGTGRRIYYGRMPTGPLQAAAGQSSGFPDAQADVSVEPIHKRIDPETFRKNVMNNKAEEVELLRTDRERVERAWHNSGYSDKVEISGPANPTKD